MSRSDSLQFGVSTLTLFAVVDNRALAQASSAAKEDNIPLLALFILSPQDYAAHDRSPRRVDFTLRNLSILQVKLHVPKKTTHF